MNITRQLAEGYAALTYAALPRTAVDAALISLADGLACMMAATAEASVAPPRLHAKLQAGHVTLLGDAARVTAAAAALGNGALAHAADFEDTFEAGMIHPNASVIPAVLALAEEEGISGPDIVTALVIGCDAACRLSLVMGTKAAARGWYHPPMITAVGAAFACARLLRLSPAQMVDAVGLVLCQFSLGDGLIATPNSHLRAMREGLAARAAVEAARLAQLGTVAMAEPLFAKGGMTHLLLGDIPDPAPMLDRLGVHFYGPEVGIKIWPACRGTHGPISLAFALAAQGITAEDIARVDMRTIPVNRMLFEPVAQKHAPQSPIEGKFSSPFCFAAAMVTGRFDLTSFADTALHDPATLALAAKVAWLGESEADELEAMVHLTDGRTLPFAITPQEWRIGAMQPADLAPKIAGCAQAGRVRFDPDAFLSAVMALPDRGLDPVLAALGHDARARGG